MADFSKPYGDVAYFGIWASETAADYGTRDAVAILTGAVIYHIGGLTGFAYGTAGAYAAWAAIGVRRSLRRTRIEAVFCEG